MRAPILVFVGISACLGTLALTHCDDTPRGEQGVDFLSDSGYYTVPPEPDAGADVLVPCVEEKDTAGLCAEAIATNGTPATHLIVCVEGQAPLAITCVSVPRSDGGADASAAADAGSFCCTLGVL
jgi:hypothetical protein